MPLPDRQIQECLSVSAEFLTRRRPPPELREKVDLRVDITGVDVVIVEIRASFRDKSQKIEHPVAKAKWIGTRKVWRLFWMRRDMKWHSYVPFPEATTIEAIFATVDSDPHGCFFG